VNQAKGFYQDSFTCPEDELRFKMRAERAWNWIQKHAPDDFKFLLNSKVTHKSQYPLAIQELVALLESSEYSTFNEETLPTRIFTIMKSHGIEAKLFFADVYQILISKSSGPKLASFLLALGQKKSVELLKQAL
jgi:lysyl-tRNA synthetase class 1